MKQKLFILSAITLLSVLTPSRSQAQEAYLNIKSSYCAGMGTQSINVDNEFTTNTSTKYERTKCVLGKGIQNGVDFGYMFTKSIGVELGISHLLGGKNTIEYTDISNDYSSTVNFLTRRFRLNPSVVITAGNKKINPYAKVGCLLGMGKLIIEEKTKDQGTGHYMKSEYSGGLEFGFNGGLGVLYALNHNVSLFVEANAINSSYSPTKGKVTQYTIDGVDMLGSMTTREKEIEFVNSYSENGTSTSSDAEPQKAIRYNYSLSAISGVLGVRIHL